MAKTFSYREELISQIPAARLLVSLGYRYLTPQQALGLRGGRERNVILTGVLEEWLASHNRYTVKGQEHPFSQNAIAEAVRRISEVSLNDGLVRANESFYDLLTLGISLPQTHHGDTRHERSCGHYPRFY